MSSRQAAPAALPLAPTARRAPTAPTCVDSLIFSFLCEADNHTELLHGRAEIVGCLYRLLLAAEPGANGLRLCRQRDGAFIGLASLRVIERPHRSMPTRRPLMPPLPSPLASLARRRLLFRQRRPTTLLGPRTMPPTPLRRLPSRAHRLSPSAPLLSPSSSAPSHPLWPRSQSPQDAPPPQYLFAFCTYFCSCSLGLH